MAAQGGPRHGELMAHIVEFRSNAVRAEPLTETAQGSGAQIIIFPGVRRERHVEVEQVPKSRRRASRPKRDTLELPD
jgi:ribosomal protein L34E